MSGLQFDNIVFPDRKQIVQNNTHLDNVIDQAKNIDILAIAHTVTCHLLEFHLLYVLSDIFSPI